MEINNLVVKDFYSACCENDIDRMRNLLTTMNQIELEELQSIRNSIIDMAFRNGHYDIVKSLFPSIENLDDCPTLEEKTNINKYVCQTNQIGWMKVDEYIHREAEKWRWLVKNSWEEKKLDWLINEVQTDYIDRELKTSKDYEKIQEFFQQAKEKSDPSFLITAYTAETYFHKELNKQLAIIGGNFKSTDAQDNRCGIKCYLRILLTHPSFDRMIYIGQCYRGMAINEANLDQYEQGSQIMNKSFLSTSTDCSTAIAFARIRSIENKQPYAVLCTYKIHTPRIALDIAKASAHNDEKEVLIMPYTAFHIISIRKNEDLMRRKNRQPDVYIDLEESLLENFEYNQQQMINNKKALTRFQRFKIKFNKWLGNEDN